MRRFAISVILIAGLAMFASPAMANWGDYGNDGGDDNSVKCSGHSCNTSTDNSTVNKGGAGGDGGDAGAIAGSAAGAIAGAAAGAVAGSASGSAVLGSGNSSVGDVGTGILKNADIGSNSNAQQGQIGINKQSGVNKQGQIGINKQEGTVTGEQTQTGTVTGTQTGTVTGTNEATGSGNSTEYTDNSVYEAQDRNPVASAAPVFATACSRGASAQGIGMGGAVAFTNELCDAALGMEIATQAAYGPDGKLIEAGVTADGDEIISGMEFLVMRQNLAINAVKMAQARNNIFRRWCQHIPVLGQFF